MKSRRPFTSYLPLAAALLLLGATMAAIVLFFHGTVVVPPSQCSPVYQRYAHVPGIEASFVKDFPLNDTLAIDVTLLHATTDSAWQRLKEDFGPDHLTPKMLDNLNKGKVASRFAPKSDYSLYMDTICKSNNDLISFSFTDQIVCVFHIENALQIHAVKMWQLNAMINNDPLISIENENQSN